MTKLSVFTQAATPCQFVAFAKATAAEGRAPGGLNRLACKLGPSEVTPHV